ncbi:hypothetical protein WMY93_003400 [Mugilogobius chulae]|uniref:ST8 alpha-N-acetyl-neuraminide alpha-2,8-sialyltransferase 6 n=1 Tax=Mugilogobius chulae TaxID=88201 RepID=A0AAW0PZ89_9GOBI
MVGFKQNPFHINAAPSKTNTAPVPSLYPGFPLTDKANPRPRPQSQKKPCNKFITNIIRKYSSNWTEHEENHQNFRSLLINNCNGFQKAMVTKANTPVKTKLVFDADGYVLEVQENVFNTFVKDSPFSDTVLDTCAVVGNGGILGDSGCGEAIDSAQFVIRCNLPSLDKVFTKHVGRKTSLVTANPGIITNKYGSLLTYRRRFVEDLQIYRDSMIFLPAFSFKHKTQVCLRAAYTLGDFRTSVKPVFMNPEYLKSLDTFWRSQGLDPNNRLSTGLMMVSLALEVCNNVDVYGFWPFGNHPHTFEPVSNHYYDNQKPSRYFHDMPEEFAFLLKLHSQGILRLHLGQCAF